MYPTYTGGTTQLKCVQKNYRGNTVQPALKKLFDITVQKRLEFIDVAFKMSEPHHAGFQKGCRTVDNVLFSLGKIL